MKLPYIVIAICICFSSLVSVKAAKCSVGQWVESSPLGECSCLGQFFMGQSCQSAFFCDDGAAGDNPDPELYQGCHVDCLTGEVISVDYETNESICVPEEPSSFCLGSFEQRCQSPGGDLNQDLCQCEGELHYNEDCRQAFYCDESYYYGGKHVYCGPGQMVSIEFPFWDYTCVDYDPAKCPGLGGFGVGCTDDGNVGAPPMKCRHVFAENPLGSCEGCEGQLFVGEDCGQGFYCSEAVPLDQPETNGCYMECPEGQRVYVNEHFKQYLCLPIEEDFICPGKFKLQCPDGSGNSLEDVVCGCRNEIWVSEDCSRGFRCAAAAAEGDAPGPGDYFECGPGQIINVDLHDPVTFECTDQLDNCIGAYHFGCEGGDFGKLNNTLLTTPGTTTTTEMDTTTAHTEISPTTGSENEVTSSGSATTITSQTEETTTTGQQETTQKSFTINVRPEKWGYIVSMGFIYFWYIHLMS